MSDILSPITPPCSRVTIRPWYDPVVDDDGHDPRSRYVETFWLGVLGPTATWLMRRLAAGLDHEPDGYEIDLEDMARAMGLGFSSGRASPFSKALQRCVMFGLAHPIPGGLAVRRRVPSIAHRHLRRMPVDLQAAHHAWATTTITLDALTQAHRLATAMFDIGDDPSVIEHQLVALGVCDAVAAEAADNLARLTSNPPSDERTDRLRGRSLIARTSPASVMSERTDYRAVRSSLGSPVGEK